MPSIHNIAFSNESHLVWIRREICTDQVLFTSENSPNKHAAFRFTKVSVDGLEWCGLLVDYCDVCISCLDSYSDGTHSLQRIHWWTSDAMLHFSKSVQWRKNSYIWIKAWGSTFSLSVQILGSTFLLTIYIYRIFILTSSWSTSCSSRVMRVSESWLACSWQEPMWSSSSSTSAICCISTIFCNRREFHLWAFCCIQLVRNCLYRFSQLAWGRRN